MSNTTKPKSGRRKSIGAKLTTTLSIALVLFVVGLMAVGGLTAVRLTEVLREQFTVTIEMSDYAAPGYGARLASSLDKQPYTKAVTYISADSALQILTTQLGENPESFLGYNPLHASVELQLSAEYAENDSIELIVKRLKAQGGPNIESIDYNHSLVDIVNKKMRKVALVLLVLAALFLIICVSLISNTVRMAMYADRFLINTMQLVGATNWFIRRPFIWQNIVCGFVAAGLALIAIAALLWYGISQGMRSLFDELLLRPMPIIVLVAAVVLTGILIPAIAAWVSADKYLRRSVDDLYLM